MANIPIDAVQLPTDVERGAQGGPLFNTVVHRTDGGQVSSNKNWDYPLYRGQVAYGIQRRSTLDLVTFFFWARRGRWRGFLFKDWNDYSFPDQLLGTGDGALQNFPIKKTYPDSVLPFVRPITRPIVSTLIVKKDGTPTAAYTVLTGGVIRFNVAPTIGQVLTVSGEFNVPVQFDTDQLIARIELDGVGGIPDLPIIEVRE